MPSAAKAGTCLDRVRLYPLPDTFGSADQLAAKSGLAIFASNKRELFQLFVELGF
jgi:hypothetical protein